MVFRNFFVIVLLLVLCTNARSLKTAADMSNSAYSLIDSFAIDSADVVYSKAFSLDDGAQKTLLIEMRDDSAAGFASDRGAISIELIQLFPMSRGNQKYYVRLQSKADTASQYYPASGPYMLHDSLDIAAMDTAAAVFRSVTIDSGWSARPKEYVWGDSLSCSDTLGFFGAIDYISFTPDFTPAACFKVTGLKGANASGDGVKVKLYVAKLEGAATRNR